MKEIEGVKQNILVLSTMYPGKKNQTFGIFVENQVLALSKRGFSIDVAAIRDPRMNKEHLLVKYSVWFWQILCLIFRKRKIYQIVHAHYVFPSGIFGVWFKKLLGAKLVVTSHGGDIDKMAKKGPFFYDQTKKILHHADHVIAVGEMLKEEIVTKFEVPEEKVTVLNMGVNRSVFRPQPKKEVRRALGLAEESIPLLYAGNIIRAKGLIELLDAYKQLKSIYPSIELHLIGAVKEPDFCRELQRKMAKEQISDVTMHSPLSQQEVANWMAAAEVFVLPSHMEGFGLVALEAMSCHTPVVGSNVGGLGHLLGEGAGIVVEPKNTSGLIDGLEQVITNKSLQEMLIRQGEKRAKKYDQEALLDRLISIYQR